MGNQYFVTEKEKREIEKRKRPIAWFVWVLLVLVPPIGIIALWCRKGAASIKKKVIITLIALMWSGILSRILWYMEAAGYFVMYRTYLHTIMVRLHIA